jgi:hypothetical protein
MRACNDDIHQRLGFIDRTIDHAVRACRSDRSVPEDMRYYVNQLGQRSDQARQALHRHDAHGIRQSVDDLARLSDQAQSRLRPADGMNYALKSAVILTHIELSALRNQLD